ncbi:hypothetical protein ACYZT8_10050 [Pseudomonas sp. LB3P93]|jgi:hypothetical protein
MFDGTRSADQLAKTIIDTPGVLAQIQANPEETLKKLSEQAKLQVPRALEQDVWIYRVVVSSLGLVTLLVVLGSIALSLGTTGQVQIPDVLTALGSAAIGALAGILAPSPAQRN